MSPVLIGPTANRSILGSMNDFALDMPFYLKRPNWGESDLRIVELKLWKTPCRTSRPGNQTIFPHLATSRVLASRWSDG